MFHASVEAGGKFNRRGLPPFRLEPLFVFCLFDYALLEGLVAKRAGNTFQVVIHNGWYLGIFANMLCSRKAFCMMDTTNTSRVCAGAHRVTLQMAGGSPGQRMLYEAPLYVVPTSKAKTSFRAGPWYGCRSGICRWGVVGFLWIGIDGVRFSPFKRKGKRGESTLSLFPALCAVAG